MENITRFLTTKLKLKVNQTKSAVAPPKNRKFLGFSFTGGKQPRRRIAPKAILRFQTRIRELTCRTRGISMEQRAKELSAYLRGWRGYCGFCQTPRSCIALIRGSGVDCGRRSGNSGNVGAHALPSFANGGSDGTSPPKRRVVRMARGGSQTALRSRLPCPMLSSVRSASPI